MTWSSARKSITQSISSNGPLELNCHAVVVTVQRFADPARQHDEVGRTVNQVIACDANRIIGHHSA